MDRPQNTLPILRTVMLSARQRAARLYPDVDWGHATRLYPDIDDAPVATLPDRLATVRWATCPRPARRPTARKASRVYLSKGRRTK